MNCKWCDTTYHATGKKMTIKEICKELDKYDCEYVCITGGEPLLQREGVKELTEAVDDAFWFEINTNGSQEPLGRNEHAIDFKLPSSGEFGRSKIYPRNERHWYVFVIADKRDYEIAKAMVLARDDIDAHFSPCWGKMTKRQLAEWILRDKLDVKYNLQIHKVLFNKNRRGV